MLSTEFGDRVRAVVQAETGDRLRSIIGYTDETYEIHYVRPDVRETYDERDVDRAVRELRLETIENDYINDLFREMHGDIDCRIDVFREAVEMNFAVGAGAGLEVAVDRSHFADQDTLIGAVLETIETHVTAGNGG